MKWAHFKTRDFPPAGGWLVTRRCQAVPGAAVYRHHHTACTLALAPGWAAAARTSALSTHTSNLRRVGPIICSDEKLHIPGIVANMLLLDAS